MKNLIYRSPLAAGALCMALSAALTGCIDNSFDLDDVDSTIGINVDGLSLPVGQTEKIMLKDILSVDESVKLDADNLFYLVEEDEMSMSFSVHNTETYIKPTAINATVGTFDYDMASRLISYTGTAALPFQRGLSYDLDVKGSKSLVFSMEQVEEDVLGITRVDFDAVPVVVSLTMDGSLKNKMSISKLAKGFKITFPKFMTVASVNSPWKQSAGDAQTIELQSDITNPTGRTIATVYSNRANLGAKVERKTDAAGDTYGTITLDNENAEMKMEGKATYYVSQAFNMQRGDLADLVLNVKVNNDRAIRLNSVTGYFDPVIEPTIDPIHVADNVPDYLKDDEVNLSIGNSTVKYVYDMTGITASILFSASFNAVKDGKVIATTDLEKHKIPQQKASVFYYAQDDTPFDPNGVEDDATVLPNQDIKKLLAHIPDRIETDMSDGRVQIDGTEESTISFGKTYTVKGKYTVYAPFHTERGFNIVYRDTTESVGDDIEDYTAEKVTLKATAYNTVPLGLYFNVVALDKDGRVIDGITIDEADIAAGKGAQADAVATELEINGTLSDPALFKKIDRFAFRVGAHNTADRDYDLMSDQWLQLRNLRLSLKGNVTADLN